ncbi:hypothetical protein [Phytohabitans kaempferiae]|uniref:CBM6 domain-containing protein n=1 Tax=Phytohabitans kaempferiae TaxID=1620943 RepID=A0ABV6LXC5_9ACTN
MTADREGIDRLRVGGWLPPPRGSLQRGPVRAALPSGVPEAARAPAHAAPDDEERREPPPTPYEAPHVDFDEPVPADEPWGQATTGRTSRTVNTGTAVVAVAGRYVYRGRRRLGEIIAPGPRRQRARLVLAGVALLSLAIVAVATLSPDPDEPGPGQGLAVPTVPPQAPPTVPPQALPPARDQGLGSASPEAPPSPARPSTPRGDGPLTLTYEAEKAALLGRAGVLSLRAASGGRIVHNIGTEPGHPAGLVSFTEVDVPATTRYALTVDYVSGEPRTAILSINTQTHLRLSFPPSGGFDRVASRTFTIELVGGRNNLTFSNPDGFAPRLDRISLLG